MSAELNEVKDYLDWIWLLRFHFCVVDSHPPKIHRPKLSKLKSDGSRMVTIISGTSSLAERVSDKVRKLDLEQVNVIELWCQ